MRVHSVCLGGMFSLLLTSLGCQAASPTGPDMASGNSFPAPAYALIPGQESLVAGYRLTVDPIALTTSLTPLPDRRGAAQPPQALQYDVDIERFLQPDSLFITSFTTDADGDYVLGFRHKHPFPPANVGSPVSSTNRLDLGYTGRLLILASGNPAFFFEGQIRLNPAVVKNPDGFVHPGILLQSPPEGIPLTNTFPYMLLVDEAKDNRVGRSNGGNPHGNYDPATGGWQLGNVAPGNGWIGYDYLHGGQQLNNTIHLFRSALGGATFSIDLALLVKYTDPRGAIGAARRFPVDPFNAKEFAYRLPYAALDVSQVTLTSAGAELEGEIDAQSGELTFAVRDWDAAATAAATPLMGSYNNVWLVPPGAPGAPVGIIDAPGLSATPAPLLVSGDHTGEPGDELRYSAHLINTLGTAAAGPQWGIVRLTDPEDGHPNADLYHLGVDPIFFAPDPSLRLAVRTYQVVPITIRPPLAPPVIGAVTPSGMVGIVGERVVFQAAASNSPTAWTWSFPTGIDPVSSTDASPEVLLMTPGVHVGFVQAGNSAGNSATVPFLLTIASP